MASPLHLMTGSIVPFRPAVENTSRIRRPFSSSSSFRNFSKVHSLSDGIFATPKVDLQSRRQVLFNGFGNIITASRTSTLAAAAAFDESSRSSPVNPDPIIPTSFSLTSDNNQYLSLNIPGIKETESDEALYVFLNMPGVKKEDVSVHVDNSVVDGLNVLCIFGETHEKRYCGATFFLENVYNISNDTKGEIQDGMFKLTLPKIKVKHKKLESNIIARTIANIVTNIKVALSSCLFVILRSGCWCYDNIISGIMRHMLENICKQDQDSISITLLKKWTAESLCISLMPKYGKMELNSKGACVSVNMPELKIEDVKSYLKDDILFIEGKKKTKADWVYYITSVHLPENILKKPNMIKTKMKDGMYKATLPYLTFNIKMS